MKWRFYYLLIIVGCWCSLLCNAQSLTIKNVSLQPADKTAYERVVLDNNGDTCSLLKIKTDNIEGIQFPNQNQYIKATYSDGMYYVYVPTISRKLDLLHKDYMPTQLDMADFGYRKLRNGKTYLVVIDAPRLGDLKSSVIFKVIPTTSKIIFDDKEYNANQVGTIELPVSSGKHDYSVSAPDYYSQNASITIGKTEVKTIAVRLQPIMHEIVIGSNVENARVYIDNIDYGRIGKLMIPQGKHNIRVQADGYVDEEKDVIIDTFTGNLSFILKENMKIAHVHATPVTIISTSSNIYKNYKKIKEWKSGATIMFMPGKYVLSDDDGKTKKIVVGDKPMEVKM